MGKERKIEREDGDEERRGRMERGREQKRK